MAFKTLLERYETAVAEVYSPPNYTETQQAPVLYDNLKEQYDATQKWLYDTKKVNFNPDDVDYNWTKLKPGKVGTSTSLLKAQERSLPVIAALEDAKRLAKFQVSGKGLLFLAQQALLQTGNTFVSTRVINPFFVVGNSVPFLHLNRSLIPISIKGIKLDLSKSKELTGKLQQETIDTWGNFLEGRINKGSSKNSAVRATEGFFSGGIKAIGKKLLSPLKGVKDAISLGRAGSDTFGLENLYRTKNFVIASKDDKWIRFGDKIQELDAQYTNIPFNGTGNGNMFVGGIPEIIKPVSDDTPREYGDEHLTNGGTQDLLNYFPSVGKPATTPYISRGTGGAVFVGGVKQVALNKESKSKLPNVKLEDVYSILAKDKDVDDYVITRIKVGKFNMQFRSFIKDLTENVTSEMNEKNYIGRTERFISYGNSKREVTFTLQLVAMHDDELLATHTRLNYLIGSLFPQNAIQGLLQPPIAFLTIGDLFMNQPGYFRNLTIQYPYSWEVRGSGRNDGSLQLPMGADINITYAVLEKGTVFHQSPFHGVMEKF